MKWSDLIRLAATNLWRRKLRSVLTMIGVMIGTASIVVMVSIGIGINQGYIDSLSQSGELTTININSTTYYGGGGMVIMAVGSSGEEPIEAIKLDDRAVREIAALDHVTVVSPQQDFYNMTTKTGKFESSYSLTAINPDAVEALGIHVVEGSGFSKNAPSDTIEILLGEGAKSGFRNPRSSRWDSEAPDIDLSLIHI